MIDDIHEARLTGFVDNGNRFFRLHEAPKTPDKQVMVHGNTLGSRIRRARENAKITQIQLAEMVNRSQSAVAEWETGESQPRRNVIPMIAKALGVSVSYLEFGAEAVPVTKNDLPKPDANAPLAPVYASAEGGNGEMSVTRSEIVEYKTPPPRYESVKGLYGFYVVGDSMLPRIQPGELVWITPHRKPTIGQEAVFFERENDTGESRVMVKEYAGSRGGCWIVKQYNPPKEYKLDKDLWDCHLIVGIDLNR